MLSIQEQCFQFKNNVLSSRTMFSIQERILATADATFDAAADATDPAAAAAATVADSAAADAAGGDGGGDGDYCY